MRSAFRFRAAIPGCAFDQLTRHALATGSQNPPYLVGGRCCFFRAVLRLVPESALASKTRLSFPPQIFCPLAHPGQSAVIFSRPNNQTVFAGIRLMLIQVLISPIQVCLQPL